jgi:glyoxylase-like metal-dependent hydrolase (beta-lactamase superfamily II)
MPIEDLPPSKHFDLEQLKEGIFSAIHKTGGAAYSNAGIIDLGDQTIVIDAFNSLAAADDLRKAAETLTERSIDTLILTHVHTDHWFGATVFDPNTSFIASEKTSQELIRWGKALVDDFKVPEQWEQWLKENQDQLQSEEDERVRVGLQTSIERIRYTMAEMAGYEPRYPDKMFMDPLTFQGSKRCAELHTYGPGHSTDDAVVLLPQDKIAFIGDIGFFNLQPFMGFCDLEKWREQLKFFHDSEFEILVPGHGSVGSQKEIVLQLEYFSVMEELIGDIVERGGPLEEALQISLPEPFDGWLFGGMGRFEVNVRYLYQHLGGTLPDDE